MQAADLVTPVDGDELSARLFSAELAHASAGALGAALRDAAALVVTAKTEDAPVARLANAARVTDIAATARIHASHVRLNDAERMLAALGALEPSKGAADV